MLGRCAAPPTTTRRASGSSLASRSAIAWTSATLTEDNRNYLAALAEGPIDIDTQVEICHGTPFDEDVYVFDDLDALRSIRTSTRPVCLYGHTLVPSGDAFTSAAEIGAVAALEFLPGGAILAAAEPTRRGGGSARDMARRARRWDTSS